MQPGGWPVPRSSTKSKKHSAAQLSDDELRKRIFANIAVLFPSSPSPLESNPYEIVYASKAREGDDGNPWQYAMVVRRNPNGGFTPLIKGQSWATSQPWSMILQGLLDTTATLIHKTIGQATMPQLGLYEALPRYTPQAQQG
ncbi:hypothetical protein CERZMDRAFT_121239 [Cercospora zeae-maydis SCOH1-5]|uniref:Uncharacterized protein n=1 Tax=Cercospora zeae-maydis SCOH1-5 TaxID=717836 RepID=A0A6A6FG45_9PEZI|nr:hypothetical protein CERZMDRAFT_121239 [Cercospora zeae-maydis SCOH1-5]